MKTRNFITKVDHLDIVASKGTTICSKLLGINLIGIGFGSILTFVITTLAMLYAYNIAGISGFIVVSIFICLGNIFSFISSWLINTTLLKLSKNTNDITVYNDGSWSIPGLAGSILSLYYQSISSVLSGDNSSNPLYESFRVKGTVSTMLVLRILVIIFYIPSLWVILPLIIGIFFRIITHHMKVKTYNYAVLVARSFIEAFTTVTKRKKNHQ